MLSTDSGFDLTVGYYSLLRYVPDPVRDEAVNIGLFVVDEAAEWARFEAEVPRSLLRAMRRGNDAEEIQRWIDRTRDLFAAVGERPLVPGEAAIDVGVLRDWANDFGGALRVTSPQPVVGEALEEMWGRLYATLVSRRGGPRSPAVPEEPGVRSPSAEQERKRVANALLRGMQRWQNFDQRRVTTGGVFSGQSARHHADVAILNGSVTAVAKVLPVVNGSEQDVIGARALLIDAALDLAQGVVKLGIYEEPPADQVEMLAETRSLLEKLDLANVELIRREDFDSLESRFSHLFFPEHRG